jgi:hypothetical protein
VLCNPSFILSPTPALSQEVQGRQAAEDRARLLEEELLQASELLQEARRAAKALTVAR